MALELIPLRRSTKNCLVPQSGSAFGEPAMERFRGEHETQGEIEASICEGISRFEQEYMGRRPKDIRAIWSTTFSSSVCKAC